MPPRRNMCNSRTNDLTYEKLEEEPKREVSSSRTATPPLPTSTTILPPSTQQGPYLRQTAQIRVVDPLMTTFQTSSPHHSQPSSTTYHLGGPSSLDSYVTVTHTSDKYSCVQKSSEVAHTSRYRQEQETKNREELCCDCPKARESAEVVCRINKAPDQGNQNRPNHVFAIERNMNQRNNGNQPRGRDFVVIANEAQQDPNVVTNLRSGYHQLRVRKEDIPKTALMTSERDRLIVVDRDMFVMFEREHLNVSIMRMLRLKEVARKTVGMHLEFAPDYAFSDSLLLTPLCCDDIHDVTLRVSALAGCDRLVSEPLVIENILVMFSHTCKKSRFFPTGLERYKEPLVEPKEIG
ncbi:hypothetical protein Tco_1217026 [Tanacetum coccineum]